MNGITEIGTIFPLEKQRSVGAVETLYPIGGAADSRAVWGFGDANTGSKRETPLVFLRVLVNIGDVKSKSSSTRKSKPKPRGNYINTFLNRMFGQVMVFINFLLNYADSEFIAERHYDHTFYLIRQ